MQERIGNWLWTSALVLAACGGVEDPASLAKSRAALAPQPAPTSSSGSFVPPAQGHRCRSAADCAPGEECESEHDASYCAPRHEDKDYHGADAGAAQGECRHHGQDCSASASPDAGAYRECDDDEHHGHDGSDDDASEGDGHHEHEADERSGSSRGPH